MSGPDTKPGVSFLDDDGPASPWVPPPPASSEVARPASRNGSAKRPLSPGQKSSKGHRFEADLDVAELDDRARPVSSWGAKGRELNRSALTFMSRRMCYPGRHVVVAVHMIDSSPVPLFGRVVACEYEGDGLCRVELELLEVPEDKPIRDWLDTVIRRMSAGR